MDIFTRNSPYYHLKNIYYSFWNTLFMRSIMFLVVSLLPFFYFFRNKIFTLKYFVVCVRVYAWMCLWIMNKFLPYLAHVSKLIYFRPWSSEFFTFHYCKILYISAWFTNGVIHTYIFINFPSIRISNTTQFNVNKLPRNKCENERKLKTTVHGIGNDPC